jgi:hypothetical protein
VCGVVFGRPYMYMGDTITRRENQYHLVKDGKSFIISVYKGKSKISLVSANQGKKLITSCRKFVLLFSRQNQQGGESIKAFLDGCTKEQKHQMKELLQAYREVFQGPRV